MKSYQDSECPNWDLKQALHNTNLKCYQYTSLLAMHQCWWNVVHMYQSLWNYSPSHMMVKVNKWRTMKLCVVFNFSPTSEYSISVVLIYPHICPEVTSLTSWMTMFANMCEWGLHSSVKYIFQLQEGNADWLPHSIQQNAPRTSVYYCQKGDRLQLHNNWGIYLHLITTGAQIVVLLLKVWAFSERISLHDSSNKGTLSTIQFCLPFHLKQGKLKTIISTVC
jgi:hypothetical protein